MGRKKLSATIAVLAIAVLSFFVYSQYQTSIETNSIKTNLKSLYELANPTIQAEVAAVNEESGLYKVLIKSTSSAGVNYVEVWVTKDGRLLTQNVIFVKESVAQMTNMKSFVDCLDSKGLKIYGISNHTATLLQLNLLGTYSPKLFVPCDGNLVQNCISAGVEEVPSVVFQKQVYAGMKQIDFLQNITGCKFG